MYEVYSYGPDGKRLEATYNTEAEARARVESLRNAGCYADYERAAEPVGE
jgi:hypothetical protein